MSMGMQKLKGLLKPQLVVGFAAILTACMGDGGGDQASTATAPSSAPTTPSAPISAAETSPATPSVPTVGTGRTFVIKAGPQATRDMVAAMVQLKPKDVIQFECGFFELTTGLQINGTENVTIKGCGKDKTFLSFRNSDSQEGFLASNVRGVTLSDLTIGDSPGDAVKMKGVNFGTIRSVRTIWSSGRKTAAERAITAGNFAKEIKVACTKPATVNPNGALPGENTSSPDYTVSTASGRYGVYPVQSRNILVEDTESIGASDAGIYVGQTNIAKIRNSRAAYNVFGFEIENVQDGEYSGNTAECNTGGFLVYDLDGLTQYGSRSRVFNNVSRNNNTYNFAVPGSIVANVPRGSGLITLSYDKIDIYNNVFEDNGTAGIILTSYDLLGVPGDRRMDFYSEAVNIFNNKFKNNGNDLPRPDVAAIVATQGGQVSSAFPMLVGLKNAAGRDKYGYSGAHIVWDGYGDTLRKDCPYPVDNKGQPLPADADGKPIQGNQYPNPNCTYNKYKFDTQGKRVVPKWWYSCINPNNQFDTNSRTFANFHGTKGLDLVVKLNPTDPGSVLNPEFLSSGVTGLAEFPSEFDVSKHDCMKQFGAELPRLPDFEFEKFTPSGVFDPEPAAELINKLCSAKPKAGVINQEALNQVNCPDLAQYNLFAEPANPTSLPNGRGVPYTLNTKLFSDYTTKHRTIYVPESKQMVFLADEKNRINSTVDFPVGTVIVKTFTYVNQPAGQEIPVETRLLIKRVRSDGQAFWDPLGYFWKGEGANRKAVLSQGGDTAPVKWDFVDKDSGKRITGSLPAYASPNANQCALCHANTNREPGSAPIGPKPRNLNRRYDNDSPLATGLSKHPVTGKNQIKYLCDVGLMTGCPSDLSEDARGVMKAAGHLPKFDVPGDSGFAANSKKDIEMRARAYLEVNCAHCHNVNGQASNTGFYTDVFRPVDGTHGICKKPTASGSEGRGGRLYDIAPGKAKDSIVTYRIGPEATTLAARMPPVARGVVHQEGFEVVSRWINEVVDNTYPNANACNEGNNSSFPKLPVVGTVGAASTR